jgi:hypothetical protein
MQMQRRSSAILRFLVVSFSCIILVMLIGCSGSQELRSGWTNQEFAITGDGNHWQSGTVEISGPDVAVGVKNDENHLYIGIVTSNRATQLQMLGLGCTAWFDTEGKKDKTFGIQFPVSGLLQGRRFPTRDNPAELQALITSAQRQLVIRGPGVGEQRRMLVKDAGGIEARIGYVDGTMTYELKVPLRKSQEHPNAINADLTKPLFVGLETGDIAEAMKGQPDVSNRSTVTSVRGRSGGRSGGDSGQGPGRDVPEPLKHWITVHLSSAASEK